MTSQNNLERERERERVAWKVIKPDSTKELKTKKRDFRLPSQTNKKVHMS